MDHPDREVAESLEVAPELLPLIPELLRDLEALGAWPDAIAAQLRPLGLPAGATRALDLACGKGAVALELAETLGFRVDGVDRMVPFIEHARRRAVERGVAHLCRFEVGDLRDALARARDYDVVVYAALGGLLGGPRALISALRGAVRPHGYMVIDEGFLASPDIAPRPGYELYRTRDAMLEELTSLGDVLVGELVPSEEEVRARHAAELAALTRAAEDLARARPGQAAAIGAYLARQREEYAVLDRDLVAATWVFQKDGPARGPSAG